MKNFLLSILTLLLIGCSGTSDNGAIKEAAGDFGGPGSVYNVNLNTDASFLITKHSDATLTTLNESVSGTFSVLPSGYLKMSIDEVQAGTASVGDLAYGLQIPGFALMLKPVGGDDKIIPLVESGVCPQNSFDMNWIVTSYANDPSSNGADILGTASYDGISSLSVPYGYNINGSAADGFNSSTMSGSCSNGIMSVGGGVTMWLTKGGAALIDVPGVTTIVGMPGAEFISSSDLDGNYVGIKFDENAAPGEKTSPIWLDVSGNGQNWQGGEWLDVDFGVKDSSANSATITMSQFNQPALGFIRGTVKDGDGSQGNITCSAKVNIAGSGKVMMFCVGTSPSDNTKLYNAILVSQ